MARLSVLAPGTGALDIGLALGLGVIGACMVVVLPFAFSIVLIGVLIVLAALTKLERVDDLAAWLLVLTALTMPMNRVAVALIPASDLLLLLTAGLYLLIRLASRVPPAWSTYRPIVIGLVLLALGGLAGALAEAPGEFLYKALGEPVRDVSGWDENTGNLAKFVVGSFVPIGTWLLARPDRPLVRRVLGAYLIGAFISAVVGFALPMGKLGSRSIGLTVHPNQFGSLCLLALGVGVGFVLSQRRIPAWAYVVFPTLTLGVLLSGSRAALGGVVILALVIGPATGNRAVMGVLMTGVAIVVLLFATGVIRPEGQNALGRTLGSDPTAEGSSEIRSDLADRVFDRWWDRPLTGQGYNYMRPSHNVYLGVLASAGVLGVLGFGTVIGAVARRAWRSRADLLALSVSAGYGAYLLTAYFDNIFWWRWLWFTVGMVVAVNATAAVSGPAGVEEPSDDEPEPERRRVLATRGAR